MLAVVLAAVKAMVMSLQCAVYTAYCVMCVLCSVCSVYCKLLFSVLCRVPCAVCSVHYLPTSFCQSNHFSKHTTCSAPLSSKAWKRWRHCRARASINERAVSSCEHAVG